MTDPAWICMLSQLSHKHLLHSQFQFTTYCNSLEVTVMKSSRHDAIAARSTCSTHHQMQASRPSNVCHDHSNGHGGAGSKALALRGCAKEAVSGHRESLIWVCLNHFWGLKVALLQTFKVQATGFVHLRSMCTFDACH